MKRMMHKIPLLKRLYPSLLRRWANFAWVGGYRIADYQGVLLNLHHKNFVDRQIAFYGDFEERQMRFFFEKMRAERPLLFLDIGANFGLYALYGARHKTAERIHAFEPDPRNIAQFQGHLFLNGLVGKIHLHAVAVSEQAGDLPFTFYPDTSTGQTRVSSTSEGAVMVKCVTLDDLFPETEQKIFLKVDVEGHELSVLRGASQLLQNNDCFLQVECFPVNAEAVEKFMAAAGYAVLNRIEDDYYFSRRRKN